MATGPNTRDIDITSFASIQAIEPETEIADSVTQINTQYGTLYSGATGIEYYYDQFVLPIIEYYAENISLLRDSYDLALRYNHEWTEFLTIVNNASSKWIKPMSLFYPKLIEEPLEERDVEEVNNWLRKYFPIRNTQDNTLNYVEGQFFYVNCYTYNYASQVNVLDQPTSYCNCETQSGNITLHCITRITGGWIHCSQGAYNCNRTVNCYPSLNVDCWYESPYLKLDGTPIRTTDPVSQKQKTISKIQANITMNYTDRRETGIKTLIFRVENCDWQAAGVR